MRGGSWELVYAQGHRCEACGIVAWLCLPSVLVRAVKKVAQSFLLILWRERFKLLFIA